MQLGQKLTRLKAQCEEHLTGEQVVDVRCKENWTKGEDTALESAVQRAQLSQQLQTQCQQDTDEVRIPWSSILQEGQDVFEGRSAAALKRRWKRLNDENASSSTSSTSSKTAIRRRPKVPFHETSQAKRQRWLSSSEGVETKHVWSKVSAPDNWKKPRSGHQNFGAMTPQLYSTVKTHDGGDPLMPPSFDNVLAYFVETNQTRGESNKTNWTRVKALLSQHQPFGPLSGEFDASWLEGKYRSRKEGKAAAAAKSSSSSKAGPRKKKKRGPWGQEARLALIDLVEGAWDTDAGEVRWSQMEVGSADCSTAQVKKAWRNLIASMPPTEEGSNAVLHHRRRPQPDAGL